jgi:hypothetical protein
MLNRDLKFWDAITNRKIKSKKRRSRKFLETSTNEQFIIDTNFLSDIEDYYGDNMNKIETNINELIKISDQELIMQLANIENDINLNNFDLNNMNTNSTISLDKDKIGTIAVTTSADYELKALEDLEKELGLDNGIAYINNSNSNSKKSPKTTTPTSTDNIISDSQMDSLLSAEVMDTNTNNISSTQSKGGGSLPRDDSLDELEQYLQSLSTTNTTSPK